MKCPFSFVFFKLCDTLQNVSDAGQRTVPLFADSPLPASQRLFHTAGPHQPGTETVLQRCRLAQQYVHTADCRNRFSFAVSSIYICESQQHGSHRCGHRALPVSAAAPAPPGPAASRAGRQVPPSPQRALGTPVPAEPRPGLGRAPRLPQPHCRAHLPPADSRGRPRSPAPAAAPPPRRHRPTGSSRGSLQSGRERGEAGPGAGAGCPCPAPAP